MSLKGKAMLANNILIVVNGFLGYENRDRGSLINKNSTDVLNAIIDVGK